MSVTINLSMSLQYHILHMLKKKKKRGLLGPEFVTQQVWGGGGGGVRECAFVTGSQVLLLLPAWGPHFEDHSSGLQSRSQLPVSTWLLPAVEKAKPGRLGGFRDACPALSGFSTWAD